MASKFKSTKGGISLPPGLREEGMLRAERLGLRSFSEYVSALILADLEAPDEPFVIYPRKLKKGTAPAGSRTPSPRQGRSVGG